MSLRYGSKQVCVKLSVSGSMEINVLGGAVYTWWEFLISFDGWLERGLADIVRHGCDPGATRKIVGYF